MDTAFGTALKRITDWFPNSDATVIGALLGHRDAVARYLAQVHEVTVAEVAEVLDALLGHREMTLPLAAE
ncbi:hypothetical protein GQ651_05160 [Alphaproteobacteria bacterium GH1-50]|uniref:Uncharacterized protein n=1 Tax=Kangsaoukella pontilimi TaxID=2691042 RepID=A0A7C9IFG6_9RHOB|nr:hypothetical protein [Kangsaoukella pontilimi]MXQ07229.1 hypothetical protein [Kangsaoukella pontilimi]